MRAHPCETYGGPDCERLPFAQHVSSVFICIYKPCLVLGILRKRDSRGLPDDCRDRDEGRRASREGVKVFPMLPELDLEFWAVCAIVSTRNKISIYLLWIPNVCIDESLAQRLKPSHVQDMFAQTRRMRVIRCSLVM